MTGEFTVELLSDTCFSAPTTRSVDVDTDIATDRDGLPFVSGKTIRALLRDTWLSSRDWLDPAGLGADLFGVPYEMAGGKLRFGDAALSEPLTRWLRWARDRPNNPVSADDLLDALTVERTMTAMDPMRDAPANDTLRTLRALPKGTVLSGRTDSDSDLSDSELRLLSDVCGATRHVGLHRNRGMGHVSIQVRTGAAPETIPATHSFVPPDGVDTVFLPVRLTLTAPVLLGADSPDPNAGVSHRYIPGAALRGCVAAAIMRDPDLSPDARGVMIGDLIVGDLRYLNAYLEIGGDRSLPTPVSWTRKKDARYEDDHPEAKPADGAQSDPPTTVDSVQRAPIASPYHAKSGDGYVVAAPAIRNTVHQQRDHATGASRKDGPGTVFTYEAIEADQTFVGFVAFPAHRYAALAPHVVRYLSMDRLRIGRSAGAGYGGSPVVSTAIRGRREWTGETAEPAPNLEPGDQFILLLTSHAVVRHIATGQHDPLAALDALAERFASVARPVPHLYFARTVRVTGMNRLWRTAYPSVPALAAGSVAVFEASASISAGDVTRLQSTPIGERTADGFGCFVVRRQPGGLSLSPASSRRQTVPMPLGGQDGAQLRSIQTRLFRRELHRLVAQEAITTAKTATHLPRSASPLQRMRTPLRPGTDGADTWKRTYMSWFTVGRAGLESGALRKTAMSALQRVRIVGGTLDELLRNAASDDWMPPLPAFAGGRREDCVLCGDDIAKAVWADEHRKCAVIYLDTLLSHLARRAAESRDER
jgi:hypothetical protein